MNKKPKRLAIGGMILFMAAFSIAIYFTFAAVQGEYGLFRRIQVQSQEEELKQQLAALDAEVAMMRNKTRRLSDDYLDLDLLDEQARRVLGLVRGDEIVIR